MIWHIITGEYPPQLGGISHYSEQLAAELARNGCRVHVWCPASDAIDEQASDERASDKRAPGVEVHRLPGIFSPRGLLRMGRELNGFDGPRTLLVEYAPNAFGCRGLNLFFCIWLLARSVFRRDDVRVMFHEPFFYFGRQRLRRNLLAAVNRVMAVWLIAASRTIYLSIPAWERMLARYCLFRRPEMIWLPVPATIPRVDDRARVRQIRRAHISTGAGRLLVGHFGTYGEHIAGGLAKVLIELLDRRPGVAVLCLGARGEKFVAELSAAHTRLAGRLLAPGLLSPEELSLHLQACDLCIQPYPDGATSRRTSLMAALINGVPVVTTVGRLTEPVWSEAAAVSLAKAGDAASITSAAERLLDDADLRSRAGLGGRQFYEKNFAMSLSVETLLEGSRQFAPDSGVEVSV